MAFIVGCTCFAYVQLVEPQGRRYTGNGNTLVLYIKYIVPITMLFPGLHAHSLAMFPASVMSIHLIKRVHLQLALSYGQSLLLVTTSLLKNSVYFTSLYKNNCIIYANNLPYFFKYNIQQSEGEGTLSNYVFNTLRGKYLIKKIKRKYSQEFIFLKGERKRDIGKKDIWLSQRENS